MRLPPGSKALESVELQIGMYEHMEKQQVKRFNWRHGSAFLAANIRRAVSYGTKSYGSELIRETFTLLDLLDEEAPGRSKDLLENYPEVAELRPISSYPSLIRLDRVPVSELKDEHGGDPNGMIEWASSIDSEIFRPFSQALNFKLVTPVPSSRLCAFRVVNCTNEYFDGAPEEFELDPID